jgi:hypothetical protein
VNLIAYKLCIANEIRGRCIGFLFGIEDLGWIRGSNLKGSWSSPPICEDCGRKWVRKCDGAVVNLSGC